MVEWFKAAVLKTAEGQLSEGSNPSFSAIFFCTKKNGGMKPSGFRFMARSAASCIARCASYFAATPQNAS